MPDLDDFDLVVFRDAGQDLERRLAAGEFVGVLDLHLGELSAGSDRLFAAAMRSLPQVIAPGGLDRVRLPDGPPRPATPAESDKLGQELAQRACASNGPTAILWPAHGFDPDGIMFQSLRNWLGGWVDLVETPEAIGSPAFIQQAAELWVKLAGGRK